MEKERQIKYFIVNGQKEYIMINAVPMFDSERNFLYGIVSSFNINEFMRSQQNLKLVKEQLFLINLDRLTAHYQDKQWEQELVYH